MEFKLTRIAPTSSGFLHLGNLYSFLITSAVAERHGAKILLRIDDLDRERFKTEYVQDIFDTLDFMEIGYDLGPKNLQEFDAEWSQIHRLPQYEEGLQKLSAQKILFACDCSRKKIQQMDSSGYYLGHCQDRGIPLNRPDVAWRFNTFMADFIQIQRYPANLQSHVLPEDTAFFVVRKKDKQPAYQLTCLIDDLHFGVDLIVRGTDLFGSTLAQQLIAQTMGNTSFSQVNFLHHTLIKGAQNEKLSKSEGATSIQFLRKSGKKPTDIYRILGELIGAKEPIVDFESFKNQVFLS
jgi:glutamyl/glutaminyl-tRNA synthetase